MTEKRKSANGGLHSLTRREKLYVAIAVPTMLVGMVGLVATVILLVASFFLLVPRLGWLICFGGTGTVLAGLFAEPYLRIFFGSSWMVRNNVIFFWLLVLASGTATFKSFCQSGPHRHSSDAARLADSRRRPEDRLCPSDMVFRKAPTCETTVGPHPVREEYAWRGNTRSHRSQPKQLPL